MTAAPDLRDARHDAVLVSLAYGSLQLMLDGAAIFRQSVLDGAFRVEWTPDCYSDKAGMRYAPSAVASARLALTYAFLD